MNNKFLIPALLILLSGCASTNTSSTLMTGTGAGASSMGQKSSTRTASTNTYPVYSNKSSVPSSITENSIPSSGISKPTPPRYSADEEAEIPFENKTVLNQPQSARSARSPYPYAISSKKVKVEVIKTNSQDKVYLQLGVFSSLANAKMLQKKVVANQMPEPIIKEVHLNGKLAHRVQLGPISSTAKVNEFNAKLVKIGISKTWYVTENKI